jgi:hypothetical protein
VVDAIQQVTTDTNGRPIEDVRIIRAYLRWLRLFLGIIRTPPQTSAPTWA